MARVLPQPDEKVRFELTVVHSGGSASPKTVSLAMRSSQNTWDLLQSVVEYLELSESELEQLQASLITGGKIIPLTKTNLIKDAIPNRASVVKGAFVLDGSATASGATTACFKYP